MQINKTLEANMSGDAIGGSVNLLKAGDRPTLILYGLGGYTPIAPRMGGVRTLSRFHTA